MKPAPRATGINFIVDRKSGTGIRTAAGRVAIALEAAKIPHVVLDLSTRESLPFSTTLIHANPERVGEWFKRRTGDRDKVNIAYWNWEMQEFPLEWRPALQWLSGILVPSTFTAASVRKAATVPIEVVPYCVSGKERGTEQLGRRWRNRLGIEARNPVFYFTFDARSFPERKNPELHLKAFSVIAERYPEAHLIVKCTNRSELTQSLDLRLKKLARHPQIHWVDHWLTDREMLGLTAACDIYLSLHGSEGWGLPIFDAMKLGRCVIQTGYSGPMDFEDDSVCRLVPYRLRPLITTEGPYRRGQLLAAVSLESAVNAMKWALDEPEAARAMGNRARRQMDRLEPKRVGGDLHNALKRISRRRVSLPRTFLSTSALERLVDETASAWMNPVRTGFLPTVVRHMIVPRIGREIVRSNVTIAKWIEAVLRTS